MAKADRLGRQRHRGNHAPRIGGVRAGNVERGPVIHGGADDRQADRHVDRMSKGQQLHRNQTLVVVAREHTVELASRRAHEHCISGNRPLDRDAALTRTLHRRRQHAIVFRAKHAIFSSVRIEAGNGEPRL